MNKHLTQCTVTFINRRDDFCMRVRERERETDRQTDRQTETEGDRGLHNKQLRTDVGWLVGFLTSSSTSRLYRGRVLPHMRQSWETMASVSAGHIILTPTQPVGSGRPQRESNPGPPLQESRALPQSYRAPQQTYREKLSLVCVFPQDLSISSILQGNGDILNTEGYLFKRNSNAFKNYARYLE